MMRVQSHLKSLFDQLFPQAAKAVDEIVKHFLSVRKKITGRYAISKSQCHQIENLHRRIKRAAESLEYDKAWNLAKEIALNVPAYLKETQGNFASRFAISSDLTEKVEALAKSILELEIQWSKLSSQVPSFRTKVTDAGYETLASDDKGRLDSREAGVRYAIVRQEAEASGLWDEAWYLSQYYGAYKERSSRAEGSWMLPLDYYLLDGWKMGHRPSAHFELDLADQKLSCSPLEYFLTKLKFEKYQFAANPWNPRGEVIKDYQAKRAQRVTSKVVYTLHTRNDYKLAQPYHIEDEWDYVCFSEHLQSGQDGVWEIRPLPQQVDHDVENWVKLHPHLLLPEYDQSLFIEEGVNLRTASLFEEIDSSGKSLLVAQHSEGSSVQEMLQRKLASLQDAPAEAQRLERLIALYRREAFPFDYGVGDLNWIFRSHKDRSIIRLMTAWWQFTVQCEVSPELVLPFVSREFDFDLYQYLTTPSGLRYHDIWLHRPAATEDNEAQQDPPPVDLSRVPYLEPAFKERNITAVFSTNEVFIPYLAITIFSLIENSSESYNYDIIILAKDIKESAFQKVLGMAEGKPNISIRIYNTAPLIETVPTSLFYIEGRVPVETYNKCFITEILRGYERCLYLDSDLLILGDVQELHDMDLKGNSIGASCNIANVYAAYYHQDKKGKPFHEYLTHDLGVIDHSKYFQAGVLVLDMKKLSEMNLRQRSIQALKKIRKPIFFDQCLFNSIFYGDTQNFSTAWNHVWYMQPYSYLRGAVKDSVFFDYARGRLDPKIVHYAGKNKPQTKLGWSLSDKFWDYAYRSPFLDDIKADVMLKDNEVAKLWKNSKDESWYLVKPKLLVHLHLFYADQLDYMLKKLENIHGCDVDFFVTMVEKNFQVEEKIHAAWKDAKILVVQNVGYDVYPFLQVLREVNVTKYDYILKIHTKNAREGKQAKVYGIEVPGYSWRDCLVDALLGSKERFVSHLARFEADKTLGCLGAGKFIFSTKDHDEEKKYPLDTWRARIGIEGGEHYLGGTMFLARAYPFEWVKGLNLQAEDFAAKELKTKDHKNTAHVMERMFGLIIESERLSIKAGDDTLVKS